jgi:hypothetical protein
MAREKWRAKARDSLVKAYLEHEKKKGNYNCTQREAEKHIRERADLCDKKRDYR